MVSSRNILGQDSIAIYQLKEGFFTIVSVHLFKFKKALTGFTNEAGKGEAHCTNRQKEVKGAMKAAYTNTICNNE